MWLSDTSIKQPVLVTMVVVAAVIIGSISYARMGVDLLPDVNFPVIAVSTSLPGASPQEVATQITEPLEDAFASIPNLETLRSTSTEGNSLIIVELKLEAPIEEGANAVRDRLGLVANQLPDDATDPTVLRFDPSTQPILVYAVTNSNQNRSPLDFTYFVEDTLKPTLERLSGVGQVNISGETDREVQLALNLNALQARNLSVQDVSAALSRQNLSVPGGRLTQGNEDLLLKTTGEFNNVQEIAELVVAQRNGIPIMLRDIATIIDGTAERRQYTRLNGENSLILSIRKQSGANTVQVAESVKQEIERLETAYTDVALTMVRDESKAINESNQDVTLAIVLGSILAALVVLLFFRDLRNTLVTVAGMPVIIMTTFWAISLLGFTLNIMTLMALSLSIGLLIDDAIVVRENIFRRMERGEEPREAASKGTKEIAFAVLATSLAVLAVFVPVAFTSGIIGQFFRQFGLTVAMTVIISTVEAFTLAPMLSAHFFKQMDASRRGGQTLKPSRFEQGYAALSNFYERLLAWSLHHRKSVVAIGVSAFILSLGIVPFLGIQFFGQDETAYFTFSTEMPPGTTLDETDFSARHIEEILFEQPEIESVYTTVNPGNTSFLVTLADIKYNKPIVARMRTVLENMPGISFSNQSVRGDGVSSSLQSRQVLLNLSGGESVDELEVVSSELMEKMAAIAGVVDLDRSYKPGKPELHVQVDNQKAADLGVSAASAATMLRTLVNGDSVSKLREGGRETNIVVRLREQDRININDVLATTIPSTQGIAVPLSAMVTVETVIGPTQISRDDRRPQILVGANVLGRSENDVIQEVAASQQELNLPRGVTIEFAGNSQESEESFTALFAALILAILFVYMVLASQFGSFIHPLTIMLSLPLALAGALLALLITGNALGVMGMIGIILLMGLVTKNAILLIDFILQARRSGMERTEAVLRAGPMRLRPILMTTMAMIAGMLPVAIGLSPGSAWRSPMAITVIGGLITSTLLTLVVVPVVYTLLDDLQRWVKREPSDQQLVEQLLQDSRSAAGVQE